MNTEDFFFLDGAQISQSAFDTQPPPEYQVKADFPNCCPRHKNIHWLITEYYERFPNCCDAHKKLIGSPGFKKENYDYVVMKVMNTLSYTEQQITRCIDKEDWYEDITEYIEYTEMSFGQLFGGYGPPVGRNNYHHFLKDFISHKEVVPADKAKRLLNYFVKKPSKKTAAEFQADFKLLLSTYSHWLKLFPFNLPFFQNAKQHFENTLPLLEGTPVPNLYTGLASAKLTDQRGLINWLFAATKGLLQLFSSPEMVEKGMITDINQHQQQLLNEEHKVKQNSLLNSYSKGEIRYITVLKKWLKTKKNIFRS